MISASSALSQVVVPTSRRGMSRFGLAVQSFATSAFDFLYEIVRGIFVIYTEGPKQEAFTDYSTSTSRTDATLDTFTTPDTSMSISDGGVVSYTEGY